jgi:hypothetical protein
MTGAGTSVEAPPSLEELCEALAHVVEAFRLNWPPADEIVPRIGHSGPDHERATAEQLAYLASRDRALEEVLSFVATAGGLTYVGLEFEADRVLGDIKRRARGTLTALIESRGEVEDA